MNRQSRALALAMALAACLGLPHVADANWPMFQKDVTHSGVTSQDGAESDSVAWYFPIEPPAGWGDEDLIWASPVIDPAATRVYMATRFGRLYCFDLADGDSLWARDLPGGITSTPALANGLLYLMAQGDSSLYCLDATDGDSVWATTLGSWVYGTGDAVWMESSPIVVGDSVVYVGSRDGTVYCLYADDGSGKWQSGVLGDYVASSPAYHEGRVYVGATGAFTGDSGVYCLDAADGDTLWRYTYDPGNYGGTMSSPLIANGRIYIGMNNDWDPPYQTGGSLTCFLEDRQQEPPPPYEITPAWTYGINCDVRGTPVYMGGRIYVTSGKGLYAFNSDDGDLILGEDHYNGVSLGDGTETWSSFAVSKRFTLAEQETLLFVGDGGFDNGHGLYCLHPDNLDVVWDTGSYIEGPVWGSPAIAAGKVVVGANNGMVFCFVDDQENGRIVSPNGTITYLDRGGQQSAGATPRLELRGPRVAPNPFARTASIRFSLPGDTRGPVELSVVDVAGRLVRRLFVQHPVPGSSSFEWDGRTDAGTRADRGVYLYRVTSGQLSMSGRLVLRP